MIGAPTIPGRALGSARRGAWTGAGLLALALLPGVPAAWAQPHEAHGMEGFNSGNMTMGMEWSMTFTEEGEFDYVCHPHPVMKGRIVVREGAPRSGTVDLEITNYSFSPSELEVAPGTTVRWTNRDDVTHTVSQAATSPTGLQFFGLPWWQAGLAALALVAGLALMFVRPKRP